jgi:DNA polymerase-3 subunit epsilon
MYLSSTGLSLPESLQAGRELKAGGFAAIDFETATRSSSSACAVAVAVVEGGEVVDVKRWLLRPPYNNYDYWNISIHGIDPEMTKHSPSIQAVWPEILEVIDGRTLVAHSAPFDIRVLKGSLEAHESGWPDITYLCTCQLSKRAWPHMSSHKLNVLAAECDISFQHHEAGDDAAVAAELAIACCGFTEQDHILQAGKALGVPAKLLPASN